MVDVMSQEKRSQLMSRIKGSNTGPERAMSSLMHKAGLRYRRHYKHLPGRPDFVFVKAKLAVFVDGDFWHGWQFEEWEHKMAPFWRQKIKGNIERDKRVAIQLAELGWSSIRFWEHEVEEDPVHCLNIIKEMLIQ